MVELDKRLTFSKSKGLTIPFFVFQLGVAHPECNSVVRVIKQFDVNRGIG
jgi:hypothetical protein